MKRKFKVYASTSGTTLSVTYKPYRPGEGSRITRRTFKGRDLLDALGNMVDTIGLYFDSDDIADEEMTAEDVISRIESENGDGCDMIFELKDLTTGQVYISEMDYME